MHGMWQAHQTDLEDGILSCIVWPCLCPCHVEEDAETCRAVGLAVESHVGGGASRRTTVATIASRVVHQLAPTGHRDSNSNTHAHTRAQGLSKKGAE